MPHTLNSPNDSTSIPTLHVEVQPKYLTQRVTEKGLEYVFAYHVKILNHGKEAAKLLSRHWIILDGDMQRQEIKGEGVIGKQPRIEPGESYEYSSGSILATPVGIMHGSYNMITDAGQTFAIDIPSFTLASPNSLH